jgi:putative ATP-dependent endonuclease of OLD family
MPVESFKFRDYACFKDFAGFDRVKLINVIIGRNNTGKSRLLDLVEMMCGDWNKTKGKCEFMLSGSVPDDLLKLSFPDQIQNGTPRLPTEWTRIGNQFVGVPIVWARRKIWDKNEDAVEPSSIAIREGYTHPKGDGWLRLDESLKQKLAIAAQNISPPLAGKAFRRLLADRDIQPEISTQIKELSPSGDGATNLIRRYLTLSSLYRDIVAVDLLNALNEVFGSDGNFTEIVIRDLEQGNGNGPWEVFLREKGKGTIPLSASGSGLKTVILVLLNLLVVPEQSGQTAVAHIYAFEELENNLHPALFRRLLRYIEQFAQRHGTPVFLTTHSNVALDMFGSAEHAQIVHVTHNGDTARSTTISAHFDRLGVISELGAKPSDLLQANGVIWVEGPSDIIYMNRWIELVSEGRFKEGRDYQCAFYGGALLARLQFVDEDEAENDLVNLLRINPNVVVVCDSNRLSASDALKPRVRRISKELEVVPHAVCWITASKEIEGYLPGSLWQRALELSNPARDPDPYELFFPRESRDGSSFFESELKQTSIDKMALAIKSCAKMDFQDMKNRLDWHDRMSEVVSAIELWNN